MDVVRLASPTDAYSTPNVNLIEGYSSMIWTERFTNHGEFELKTPDVDATRKKLPLQSLLSHLETKEIMMTESHEITKNEDGFAELIVRGRSLTSLLEHRVIEGPLGSDKFPVAYNYQYHEAAMVYIWNCLVNNTANDPALPDPVPRGLSRAVSGSVVTDSSAWHPDTPNKHWIQTGQAWPVIRQFLILSNHGFRVIRPESGPADVVTVDTANGTYKGRIIRNSTASFPTAFRWDVYTGTDRTKDQTYVPPILFKVDSDHILNPSYIFSIRDSKNRAIVVSSVAVQEHNMAGGYFPVPPYGNTGLYARFLYVNGGSPATDQNVTDFTNNLAFVAQTALREHPYVALFDGDISTTIPFQFGWDYFLGDRVTLIADYGINQPMRVEEYIRVDDKEGDRGYPGLISLV